MSNLVVEDYRGHQIWRDSKTVYKKNPVSGHEWGENVPLSTFCVARRHDCDSPKYVAWLSKKFKSIDAAKKEIDDQIMSWNATIRVIGHVPVY
jgi:hypothetical protein